MEKNNIFEGTDYEKVKGKDNNVTMNDFVKMEENIHVVNKYDKKNSKVPIILFSLVFIVGLGIMFYPTVCNLINHSRHKYVINQYESEIGKANAKLKEEMLSKAEEYNKGVDSGSIRDVFSTDKVSKDSLYDEILNVTNDGLMGYLTIPKINVKLPVYHGTEEKELEKGVGHLRGSSLPVGGTGTHAILAAHRGLPSSKLFSDLDKMAVGDKFYISVLDKVLVYEVDNVAIVLPSELELLRLDKDKDYVTLVTCTPYGINTHRILVRGSRIEENITEVQEDLSTKELIYLSRDDKVLFGAIFGILFIIIIMVFYSFRRKHE